MSKKRKYAMTNYEIIIQFLKQLDGQLDVIVMQCNQSDKLKQVALQLTIVRYYEMLLDHLQDEDVELAQDAVDLIIREVERVQASPRRKFGDWLSSRKDSLQILMNNFTIRAFQRPDLYLI